MSDISSSSGSSSSQSLQLSSPSSQRPSSSSQQSARGSPDNVVNVIGILSEDNTKAENMEILNSNFKSLYRQLFVIHKRVCELKEVKSSSEGSERYLEKIKTYVREQFLDSAQAITELNDCNRVKVRDELWAELGHDAKESSKWKSFLNRRLHNKISRTMPFVILFLHQAGGRQSSLLLLYIPM